VKNDMKPIVILALEWKSFLRSPLFEQTILLRLLIGVYLLLLSGFIYWLGIFFVQTGSDLFLMSIVPLVFFDFLLKFIFKKNDNQFASLRRFPNSKKSIRIYFTAKEIFNGWNFYLLIFFFPYLTKIVYNNYGIIITIVSFFILFLLQLSISYLVKFIKQQFNHKLEKFQINKTKALILTHGSIVSYLLLNIKMIIRSPRLRQQLFTCLIISVLYFYIVSMPENSLPFSIRLILFSLIFSFFSLNFNQFLFSAEAAFFDQLMTLPCFRKILLSKYLLYVFFSLISFPVLCLLIPFDWKQFVQIISILFYSAGAITILSFGCIMFVNTKLDLFGSHTKMMANTLSVQALVVFLIYGIAIALVELIAWIFSPQTAVYFMLIIGIASIVLSNSWFKFLYKCFCINKYEAMEIFRTQ
jgi:hypothetical protein